MEHHKAISGGHWLSQSDKLRVQSTPLLSRVTMSRLLRDAPLFSKKGE